MFNFSADDLCLWRRACLLAEPMRSFHAELPEHQRLIGKEVGRLATCAAAQIANAGANKRPQDALFQLNGAKGSLCALLGVLDVLSITDPSNDSDVGILQAETMDLLESVTDLIRSLRSSD